MITLKHVSKKFKESVIFEDINYVFDQGKIYCIQGRNGSGKTVLLKMIAGLLEPDEGSILFDRDVYKGAIIETPVFWPHMSGIETLRYLAGIRGVVDDATITLYLEKTGLYEARNKRVGKYSLGMKQRLAIAQALMENPDVILLDEPSNSLDDEGVEILRSLLIEEKDKGKTILIATHNTEDMEGITDIYLKVEKRKLL